MSSIYCPTKDKEEYITQTQIKAGTLDNPDETVSGRIKCSNNDYL